MHFTRHGSDLAYITFQNVQEQIDNVKWKNSVIRVHMDINHKKRRKVLKSFTGFCLNVYYITSCSTAYNNNNPSLCFLEATLRNWSLNLVVWRQEPCYYCFWNKSTLVKELVTSPHLARPLSATTTSAGRYTQHMHGLSVHFRELQTSYVSCQPRCPVWVSRKRRAATGQSPLHSNAAGVCSPLQKTVIHLVLPVSPSRNDEVRVK